MAWPCARHKGIANLTHYAKVASFPGLWVNLGIKLMWRGRMTHYFQRMLVAQTCRLCYWETQYIPDVKFEGWRWSISPVLDHRSAAHWLGGLRFQRTSVSCCRIVMCLCTYVGSPHIYGIRSALRVTHAVLRIFEQTLKKKYKNKIK